MDCIYIIMPTHVCQKCGRVFKRKSGYDDHLQMKTDCALKTDISAVVVPIVESALRNTEEKTIVLSSSKEVRDKQLTEYFEKLHHLLWGRAGLSPEKAVDHMTFFIAFRLLEDQADTIGLPQECRWSYLIQCLKSGETDGANVVRKACNSFRTKGGRFRDLFPVLEITKDDVICNIVRHIDTIERKQLTDKDVLGVLFEYLINRGMQTMSDEGQYFTDRKICEKAFDIAYNIKKTVRRKDGSLCTFADWFCGTGGFANQYVHGVSEHELVNWKEEIDRIYCQDMSKNSCTITILNLLILTGEIPSTSVRYGDSFHDPIFIGENAPFKDVTIDYCFMNPPYGGDKTKGKDYRFVYSTGGTKKVPKRFEVNAEIQTIGIEDDDKVSAGVQLAMASLAPEGVCCIVLPQGFFFGVSAKVIELRKRLAEEYKIHCVVDIASGSFANTATKTSMLVFQKGVGPTETIRFIALDDTVLAETTIDDLRKKSYLLNYKQYIPQTSTEFDGFETVKLSSVVTFNPEKSKKDRSSYTYIDIGSVQKGVFKSEGTIPTAELPGRAQYSVNVGDVLLGTVRPNLEHYLLITPQTYRDDLIVSNGFSIMRCDPNKILPTYLYSILTLPSTTKYLTERATGTTYPVVDNSIIGAMEIPVPSLEKQRHIVEAIQNWNTLAELESEALQVLENQMMFYVKEMGRGKPEVTLGEVCEFARGKALAKKDFQEGTVPVIGGGTKPVGFHNQHNREPYSILVSQSGTAGHISRYSSRVWASDCFSVKAKASILDDYLYYSLLQLKDTIEFLKEGTAQPHVYPSTIEGLLLPLPPLSEQQTLQADFDEIRHKHEKIVYYTKKRQDAVQRLIPQITSGST